MGARQSWGRLLYIAAASQQPPARARARHYDSAAFATTTAYHFFARRCHVFIHGNNAFATRYHLKGSWRTLCALFAVVALLLFSHPSLCSRARGGRAPNASLLLSLPQAANAALTLVWLQMATLPVRRLVGGGSLGWVRELWNAEPRLSKTQDPLRPSTLTSFAMADAAALKCSPLSPLASRARHVFSRV
jgi:hypothetical protein